MTSSAPDLRPEHADELCALLGAGGDEAVVLVRGDVGSGKSVLLNRIAGSVPSRVLSAQEAASRVLDGAHLPGSAAHVIVIDDVDHLPHTGQELLRNYIVDPHADGAGPRLLLAASRSTVLEDVSTVVWLEPVDPELATRFVSAHAPDAPPTFVDRVVEEAMGNPSLLSQGAADLRRYEYSALDRLADALVISVPPAYGHLADEVRGCSDDARSLLVKIALAGRWSSAAAAGLPRQLVRRLDDGGLEVGLASAIHRQAVLHSVSRGTLWSAMADAANNGRLDLAHPELYVMLANADVDALDAWTDARTGVNSNLVLMAQAEAARVTAGSSRHRSRAARVALEVVMRGDLRLGERLLAESCEISEPDPDATVAAAIVRLLGYGDVDSATVLLGSLDASLKAKSRPAIAASALLALVGNRDDDWTSLRHLVDYEHKSPSVRRLRDAVRARCGVEGPPSASPHPGWEGAAVDDGLLLAIAGAVTPEQAWNAELSNSRGSTQGRIVQSIWRVSSVLRHVRSGAWTDAAALARVIARDAEMAGARVIALKAIALEGLACALAGELERAVELATRVLADPIAKKVPLVATVARDAELHVALQSSDDAMLLRAVAGTRCFRAQGHAYPAAWIIDIAAARSHPVITARGVVRMLSSIESSPTFSERESEHFAMRCLDAVRSERETAARLARVVFSPDSIHHAFEAARGRALLGDLLVRSGHLGDARSAYALAAAEMEALGALGWSSRLNARLAESTPKIPEGYGRTPMRLTAQEDSIASLAATGLSNKEIGRRLFLSPRTVSGHLYNIFPKLGITSRAGLRDALASRTEMMAGSFDIAS